MPPSKTPRVRYVFAKDTASVREPGSKYPTTVHRGSTWHADCPIVKAHPALFSEDPPDLYPRGWQPPVEQATQAPGETRESGRA